MSYKIVYSDDHLVVVDKDAGLLTVPAYEEPCLVDLLEAELDRAVFGRYRLAVVHRLDRQTSGLLVFARTPTVAAQLAKQFAAHKTEREYIAIVAGTLQEDRGAVNRPLAGKRAVTHYETLARLDDATTIAVRLETGRRNQIRLHFAELGHPVVGDTRFAPEVARHPLWPHTSLALHARVLGFCHPATKQKIRFETPVPGRFTEFTTLSQSAVDLHGESLIQPMRRHIGHDATL